MQNFNNLWPIFRGSSCISLHLSEIWFFENTWYYVKIFIFWQLLNFMAILATLGYFLTTLLLRDEECKGVIWSLKCCILRFWGKKLKIETFILVYILERALRALASSSGGAAWPGGTRDQPRGSTPGVRGWFQGDLSKKKILWRTDARTHARTDGRTDVSVEIVI